MKIKHIALLLAILLSASVVAVSGYKLKTEIIEPLELEDYMEKSIFELPFLAYTDEELMFYIEYADEFLQEEPTEPSWPEEPSEPTQGTTQPTVPATQPTVPTTQPSIPSDSVPTEPSTEPGTRPTEPVTKPTEPATKPTTEPTTKPTEPKPTNPPAPKEEPTFDFPADRVDDSWFENTLFIGDSRMLGLSLYARSGNAHYFCEASLNFRSVLKNEIGDKGNFSKMKLEELLSQHQYDKIVVNIGLNDAGHGYTFFTKNLEIFMQKVRALQPNAKIILNGIMPVTRKYIDTSKYGGEHWSPANLAKLNKVLQSYADGQNVFYIDCNEYFADSKGYLFQSVTGDGCHPTATHYKTWRDWMSWAFSTLGI